MLQIHESALWCLRPIYRLRYYIQNPKRKLKLKHLSKGNLEEDRGLLNQALKTHLITVSSVSHRAVTITARRYSFEGTQEVPGAHLT